MIAESWLDIWPLLVEFLIFYTFTNSICVLTLFGVQINVGFLCWPLSWLCYQIIKSCCHFSLFSKLLFLNVDSSPLSLFVQTEYNFIHAVSLSYLNDILETAYILFFYWFIYFKFLVLVFILFTSIALYFFNLTDNLHLLIPLHSKRFSTVWLNQLFVMFIIYCIFIFLPLAYSVTASYRFNYFMTVQYYLLFRHINYTFKWFCYSLVIFQSMFLSNFPRFLNP